MPGHDSGEISEIQSTTASKGDWETISNTSTAPSAHTPAAPVSPSSPASSHRKPSAASRESNNSRKPRKSSVAHEPKKPDSLVDPLASLAISPKKAKKDTAAAGVLQKNKDSSESKDQKSGKDKERSRGTNRSSTSKSKSSTSPTKTKAKGTSESSTGRTTLEEYFHQQSKLFSNVEKRYNAFQLKVKDEKERQRNSKTKGRK